MRSTNFAAFAAATISLALGCGGSETPAPAANAPNAAAAIPNDPVARVVYEFLDAIRQGNTTVASQRLTPLALKATAENDLLFSPPASPTARFEVGPVTMIDQDKAKVQSVWIDLDIDGKPNREQITWALRLNENQWRISGMSAEMGAGQPAVTIDFENPAMLVQRQQPRPQNPAPAAANPASGQPPQQVARDPFKQAESR